MKHIIVASLLLGMLAVGAGVAQAGPTMHTVKTTVTAITPYTHGNGIVGCTIRVAKGMNGNTLTTYDELCSLRRGERITLNYTISTGTKCNVFGRNCRQALVYTFSNAYAGW